MSNSPSQPPLVMEMEAAESNQLHMLLNDMQSIIAFVVDESSRTTDPQIKAALHRVSEFVYDLASTRRHSTE